MKQKYQFIFLFLFLGWLLPLALHAQGLGALNKKYQNGKKQLANKEFIAAMATFKELTVPSKNNIFIEYAHYFYALAALENKNPQEAGQVLKTQLEKYPDWKGKEDSYYLMGEVQFVLEDPDQAVEYLSKIASPSLKPKADTLKMNYLNNLPLEEIKLIQSNFPEDKAIAQVLVDRIAFESSQWDDILLMEKLIAEKGLETPANRKLKLKLNIKETYNICLIMPFDLGAVRGGNESELSKNALDMYQGVRLAKTHLLKEGIKINVFAYDITNNDGTTLNKAINSNELAKMDLIISSIPESQHMLLASYLQKTKTQMIHPFAEDRKFLVNEYTYLYKSTLETQAEQAVVYAQKKYGSKDVVIFFDNLDKNVRMAQAHKDAAIRAGMNVVVFDQVTVANLEKIRSSLSRLNKAETGYIFAGTTSQKVAAEIMNISDNLNFAKPIITSNAWLKFNDLDFEEYEKQDLNFIYPDYSEVDSNRIEKISSDYFDLSPNKRYPSKESFIGYDISMFFAALFKEYGTQNSLRPFLQNAPKSKNMVLKNLDFRTGNDNQYVPILELINGEMKLTEKLK